MRSLEVCSRGKFTIGQLSEVFMKTLRVCLALFLGSLLAFACGGSSTPSGGDATGGAGNGTAATAGASSAQAGSFTGSGGAAQGTAGAAQGTAGTAQGAAGAGAMGITCPAAAPMTGDMCMAVRGGGAANRCPYTGSLCTCTAGNGGAADAWNCVVPIMCPATAPATGDMCTSVPGGNAANQCSFGTTTCSCQNMGGGAAAAWNCVTPIACPAAAP